MSAKVTVIENGRDGRVQYSEGLGSTIDGYWEFGGNDVVAIVSMGSRDDWQKSHPWAAGRRLAILRHVAAEVIRQRAPSCFAEVNEERGDILLRQGRRVGATAAGVEGGSPEARSAVFVRRYADVRTMVGIGGFIVALVLGGILWVGKKALMVAPASGVPLNACVRTDTHIVSFIRYTDPHLPRITGRGGDTTTSISVLLIPLDGSTPRVLPVASKIAGGGYSLARIIGSDGHTLWGDCMGLFGVRLSDYALVRPEALRKANPSLNPRWWEDSRGMDIVDGKLHIMNETRKAALDVDPATMRATPAPPKPSNARFEHAEPADHLAAGYITSAGQWLGLHAPEELEGEFKVKSWIARVENAVDAKRSRRVCAGDLEPSAEGDRFRIVRMTPLGTNEYFNAAFLRVGRKSEPLKVPGPESAVMVYTDRPGSWGNLVAARLDVKGNVLWRAETGLDRFFVSQILPGADAFAFVGTRPPIPGKLSEPLVVLVDNVSGKVTSHSLWR